MLSAEVVESCVNDNWAVRYLTKYFSLMVLANASVDEVVSSVVQPAVP